MQFASQIGPTTMSVFVKVGMIYPFVGKYVSNCGIGSVAIAVELATCPYAVPTHILFAVVFIWTYGAFGAMYM